MAITNIEIYQDNKVGGSDLMPIHSPLVFLVDVSYTSPDVEFIYCEVRNEADQLVDTFKCIPYKDITASVRRFMFIADGILQGYMGGFDDFEQSENSFVHVPGITEIFKLKFTDPDGVATPVEVELTSIHAAKQFGEYPNLESIYNNDAETVYCMSGSVCYVYFYNNDTSNIITLDNYTATFIVSDSGGFVDGAKITINGVEVFTDTSGEAVFSINPGSYNYTIEKLGYLTKNGSFVMGLGDIIIPVTLNAQSLETITFVLDKLGYDGIESVFAYQGGATSGFGYTTFFGNTVNIDLYVPGTYDIVATVNRCSGKLSYRDSLALTALSSPVNLVPVDDAIIIDITFNVIDPINDLPGVEITKDGVNPFDEPCNLNTLVTDSFGIAQLSVYGRIGKPISGTYKLGDSWYAKKTGYTSALGRIEITESDYNPGTGHYEKLVTIKLNPV